MLYPCDLSLSLEVMDFFSLGMRYEEQNIAQNASTYISLENIVKESEKQNKTKTQGNL